jgi:hypothetical protein
MSQQKITPQMEERIIELLGRGIIYKNICETIKKEYGIDLSMMAISTLKGKIKREITKEFYEENDKEAEFDLSLQKASLTTCLSISLDLCEKHLKRLKIKEENQNGLDNIDMKMVGEIIDRLTRLKAILYATITSSGSMEVPFSKLAQQYKVEK